jgi:hypothetical protein
MLVLFSVSTSPNGWTDDFLCTQWFRDCFIPQAEAHNQSGKPILLILDGHNSHEKLIMIDLAISHGIIIFCLPPHTTHKLQPLDVGIFGPFAREWVDRCSEITEELGEEMPRHDFVKEYMLVHNKTFKPSTICHAFKKCGIWPIDSTVFKADDFSPSLPTSTTVGHVPPSFPCSSSSADDSFYATDDEEEAPILQTPNHHSQSDDEEDNDDDDDPPMSNPDSDDISPTPASYEDAEAAIPDPLGLLGDINYLVAPPPPPTKLEQLSCMGTSNPVTAAVKSGSAITHQVSSTMKRAQYIHCLEDTVSTLNTELEEAQAHNTLAQEEIASLKRKLNVRDRNSKKRPKLNVKARCLTSKEGRQRCQEHEETKSAKEQQKKVAREQREAREAEQEHQRQARDPNEPFSGSLSSKSKPDLVTIAFTLKVSKEGTKDELLKRINAKFVAEPELKSRPVFEGLFNSRRRARNSENNCPHTQTFTAHVGSHMTPSSLTPSLASVPRPTLGLNTLTSNITPFQWDSPNPHSQFAPSPYFAQSQPPNPSYYQYHQHHT